MACRIAIAILVCSHRSTNVSHESNTVNSCANHRGISQSRFHLSTMEPAPRPQTPRASAEGGTPPPSRSLSRAHARTHASHAVVTAATHGAVPLSHANQPRRGHRGGSWRRCQSAPSCRLQRRHCSGTRIKRTDGELVREQFVGDKACSRSNWRI
ncbi:hypothetical protein GUJ93_ZPchr0001g30916 [Zizania palustris]|uniref:Uncharacterized protein n=1 Tax=Zizania palustris TaxID=103762 RepID=A0A8J5SF91_ZIZPA|nr:hypothetical protein GUJ93_ZPchr0001g30916 [Zizania palustris]